MTKRTLLPQHIQELLNQARSIAAQWMSALFDTKISSNGLIRVQGSPEFSTCIDIISFEDFFLPFGGKLSGDNRWIKLAELIPCDELEDDYAAQFCKGFGAPVKPFRMALGALIIKAHLGLTDEELVEQI